MSESTSQAAPLLDRNRLTRSAAVLLESLQRRAAAPSRPRELTWLFLATAAVAIAHALATWRHTTLFWGDYGYILDLVERAGTGEVPYRDFHWGYPPLSIWVMGGLTRLVGTDLTGIWFATELIFALLVLAFIWWVRLVAPAGTQVVVGTVGLLLAVALAPVGGAPLPLGSYSPAAPVGFLTLLTGACCTLRYAFSRRSHWVILASALAGLAVLSKHDLWLGAMMIVAACTYLAAFTPGERSRWTRAALALAPALLVVLAGFARIIVTTDSRMLLDMLLGFDLAQQQAHRSAPTLEIITIQIGVVGLLLGMVLASVQLAKPADARRWTGTFVCAGVLALAFTVWLTQAYRIAMEAWQAPPGTARTPLAAAYAGTAGDARRLLVTTARALLANGARHALPIFLPLSLFVMLALRRPRTLPNEQRVWFLCLLAFGLSLRARRLFEFTEWFVVLVEVPVYAALLAACVPAAVRSYIVPVRAVLAGLTIFAAAAYWQYGRGAFTRRGFHPLSWTPRGWIRSGFDTGAVSRVTAALDSLDSTRARPLFSYGYTNGFNYFTDRPYPARTPIGFRTTRRMRPDSTVQGVLRSDPPAIVIDGPFYDDNLFPKAGIYWFRWERLFERPAHLAQLRRDFQPILDHCPPFKRLGDGPRAFTLHDCAAKSEGVARASR